MREHAQRCLPVIAVAVAAFPAIADEGRIPIPFQAPVTFPIVIATPGEYVLTRDLVPPGGTAAIEIASPKVEIDLNGKVISGGEPGIRIEWLAEAVIRNGSIEGGGIGIHGVTGINDVVIEDVHFSDMASQAILLNDPDAYVVRRCIIEDLNGLGVNEGAIDIANGANSQGTVESNVLRRVSGHAIRIDSGSGIVIRDNRVKEVTMVGISVDGEGTEGPLIAQNTVEGCGSHGIYVRADGSELIDNLVVGSGGFGMVMAGSDGLISGNVVRRSFSQGLLLSAQATGNQIHGNVLNSNGTGGEGYGLFFDASSRDNAFGHNTASGNSGGPCVSPVGNELCDDAGVPFNYSFGDNLMPPSAGLF